MIFYDLNVAILTNLYNSNIMLNKTPASLVSDPLTVLGAATRLEFSASLPASIKAGSELGNIQVNVEDDAGNPASLTKESEISLVFSGGRVEGKTTNVLASSESSTIFKELKTVLESYSGQDLEIRAIAKLADGKQIKEAIAKMELLPASAPTLKLTTSPEQIVAGMPFSVNTQVVDSEGKPVRVDAEINFTFAEQEVSISLNGDSQGVAEFKGISKAGDYSPKVSINGSKQIASAPLNISILPAKPHHLAFLNPPPVVLQNHPFSLEVGIYDEYNNVVSNYNSPLDNFKAKVSTASGYVKLWTEGMASEIIQHLHGVRKDVPIFSSLQNGILRTKGIVLRENDKVLFLGLAALQVSATAETFLLKQASM